MIRKNILVFPCGSEIGLEVYRSLRYSTHINLIGASSVDDHGKFVFENYIGDIPLVDHPEFIPRLANVIAENNIDAVYPTMDKVIHMCKQHENELGCRVISSPLETTEICTSKRAMYGRLKIGVLTPEVFESADAVKKFPVFVKPDKGYGSRDAKKVNNRKQLEAHLEELTDAVVMEFLPGDEFTVDCFTNYKGALLFVGPRRRSRIVNGISVNSATISSPSGQFKKIAEKINGSLTFRGAWFFQVMENTKGELVLLEIAARLGGTSGVHRMQGVNFALLSVFDAFKIDIDVVVNNFGVEVDRALDSRYRVDLQFDTAYIDLDDTLIVNGEVNLALVGLIYQFIGQKKKVVLLTKHELNVEETIQRYRISGLFDEIIHLGKADNKSDHIRNVNAIFIDDSFAERKAVSERLKIAVFAPDAIGALMS